VETISFARGGPPPECLPHEELAECARSVLEREGKTILSYGSGAGYTPLRELIGEWFGVHPYRVLLTNGSLQGLDLLAKRFVRGENVMVEYPTYDRALKLLLGAGASLLAAVVDDEGLNVDDVELQLMGKQKPAFVYTIPTFQNPTGRTLPGDRRRSLVQALMSRDIRLVEDDPYTLLRFEGEAQPALFDFSGKQSIYCSSFSETIAPGLRVGWLIVPDELAGELTEAANSTYITPSLLSQAVVCEFLRRGSFEPHLRQVNDVLRARRDTMLVALEKHFAGAKWTRPEGGHFVWLEVPMGTDMRAVLQRAEGVTAVDGTEFSAPSNMVRLSYSCVSPEEIETGIERLAAALSSEPSSG
jgi:2-aminoadipate transaminase